MKFERILYTSVRSQKSGKWGPGGVWSSMTGHLPIHRPCVRPLHWKKKRHCVTDACKILFTAVSDFRDDSLLDKGTKRLICTWTNDHKATQLGKEWQEGRHWPSIFLAGAWQSD